MSQQNLLNGVPPQMNQIQQNVVANDKLNHFNGIHSSQSSRDSSPSTHHFNKIPASQLPPITSSSSSLTTPVASNVPRPTLTTTTTMQNSSINTQTNQLTQKMGQLSVNSPQFGTTTPTQIVQQKTSVLSNSAFSPITPTSSNLQTNQRPVMNQIRPILAPQQQQQFNSLNMPQMNQNRPVLNQNPVIPPLQQQNRQINNYYNQGRVDSGLPPPIPQPTTNQSPNVPSNISQTTPNYPGNLQQQQQPPLPTSMQYKTNLHVNRYPQSPQYSQPQSSPYHQQQQQNQQQYYPENSVTRTGFNKLWGYDHIDLLQNPNILPSEKLEPPNVYLGQEQLNSANCNPELFRCTMTKIPETNSLLQKSRLPLGVLIHPFKDLAHLPVIQCHIIVRCRACRTYINPFVYFVDMKRWKCNLCYRLNDLPEEFQYDPVSKTYGDPSRRPEIKSSTIEYIAPAEYMLRPPQPAIYLFLFDISRLAIESGYLQSVCSILLDELKNLPGDARTQVGIIAYDSTLHFFQLGEGLSQPHEMIMLDIDDVFLPSPDNLLINLKDCMDLLIDLLNQLPTRYNNCYDNNSALGAALQAGYKLMCPTGGRITVFQATLPNYGPGALLSREDPNQRSSNNVTNLNPANDFYKRLALECSAQQIAVDLFIINSQYVDIATISGISQFSGGCINHFPLFKASNYIQNEQFERCLRRYLTRKIGFESVMRIRCTRGLSIHTFHGNFFVRSTDLLSLPNINPDAGFGMQVSIDENLTDVQTVCFQAALLYTSSKGERRIRVHTLCLPVCNTLMDVVNSADQQCIIGLLAKMAVDRSLQSSLVDAREAFINAAIDIISSYKLLNNIANNESSLLLPNCLKLLPLYISAILKYTAFRIGISTRLDDRVKAMIDMKTKPLIQLIQIIYPDLYPVHNLDEYKTIITSNDEEIPQPPHLRLTARYLHTKGAFLMDCGQHMILLVCPGVSQIFLNQILGVQDYQSITDDFYELPILDNIYNTRLHRFINYLNDDKPYAATLHIIRDNSTFRVGFYERLIEDRYENLLSYHEFLQNLKSQVK